MVDIMTTNIERNESENEIRKLRKNYEYDEKVSTLLEDERIEKIKEIERKKTIDVLFLVTKNSILIALFWIVWEIIEKGIR
jgi:non-homologous end joining protein Ku|tara:strand:- start:998 stop:1240 length:243 start_codon:yes stop_codon:yes gene_type:complete